MKNYILKLLFIATILTSCTCDDDLLENIINIASGSGCTDPLALTTSTDDCMYSKVAFYASANAFNGVAITQVSVIVDGNSLGSTNGTFYPNGPGNCSTPGIIPFEFSSGESVDWNATVFLVNGATIFTSGTVTPSSVNECIIVNMTTN